MKSYEEKQNRNKNNFMQAKKNLKSNKKFFN